MLKDYYYTDKEELDSLRLENAKLNQELIQAKAEIENLKRQVAINGVILSRGTGKNQKIGGKTNGDQEN